MGLLGGYLMAVIQKKMRENPIQYIMTLLKDCYLGTCVSMCASVACGHKAHMWKICRKYLSFMHVIILARVQTRDM